MDISPSQNVNAKRWEDGYTSSQNVPLFENPFSIEDLLVFDDEAMHFMLSSGISGLTVEDLAWSMHDVSKPLVERFKNNLPPEQRRIFVTELRCFLSREQVEAARRRVLDGFFWELTYWKTPELYEELTEGEQLHPGIFEQLEPDLRGKTVLDAGAGSGRASFECIRYGAELVFAVEPSPGLLRILEQKLANQPLGGRISAYRGRFDQIPLEDEGVDLSLTSSAFTAEPWQGGEPGLAELRRVTKRGGKIVVIWPRRNDYAWLNAHGFHYVALPLQQEMMVRFRTLQSALRCTRLFYAHNGAAASYIRERQKPEVPFSVLGINPPCDYCWLVVK